MRTGTQAGRDWLAIAPPRMACAVIAASLTHPGQKPGPLPLRARPHVHPDAPAVPAGGVGPDQEFLALSDRIAKTYVGFNSSGAPPRALQWGQRWG